MDDLATDIIEGALEKIAGARKFGLVLGIAFLIFGLLLLWRHPGVAPYFLAISAFFFIARTLFPLVLVPVEKWWMKFAEVLGVVMTFLLLNLTYYLVMTPIGLLVRLLGKDLLSLKIEKQRESYWIPVEENGPGTRPFLPY